ncbi:MAG: CpaF family protein [Candidatus Dormibacteria bacterium]|jgi:pilus assembly protein CpaF
MPRWRTTATRDTQDVLATALPQMALEQPLTALAAMQLSNRLLGTRLTAKEIEADDTVEPAYQMLRHQVHARLVEETAYLAETNDSAVRERLAELINQTACELGEPLGLQEGMETVARIHHELLGFGPLERLLADPSITEIMVNGPHEIWIERGGRLSLTPYRFETVDQLMQVIDRMVSRVGRRIDESSPMVDARLEDGSRIHVVIPPVSLKGPTLTVRRFTTTGLEVKDLVDHGTATADMMGFLRACVRARLNILVSGGTGVGKTTTLNVISSFIPDDERIVTIEDAAELKLRQRHVLSLETRPANVEGRGQIVVRDLVISSLRMRPDRLVVGECRGGEALDMLQAMSTGHDGSLTTLHASSPREAISRLETMVLMAGTELPTAAIRGQIGSAIDLIVQQGRLRDGSRRILSISEIIGVENGEVQIQELFRFEQTGVDADGRVLGQHVACGRVPRRTADILASGEDLDMHIFVAPDRPSGPDHPRRRLADWVPATSVPPPPLAAADRRRRSDWLPGTSSRMALSPRKRKAS